MITGASSGIGEGLARELARQRWRVGLIARRGDRLAAVDRICDELGAVDLLIVCAGVGKRNFLQPFSVDAIEEMVRVNVLSVVFAFAAVLPEMIARRVGHIAAVSSSGVYKGLPGSAGYCAGKAAVNTFLEDQRIQLRDYNIAVTTICPGFVRTAMTDPNTFHKPWLQEPDDAARRIVGALKRRQKVYNFPWQMAMQVRALRWLPDWIIARALPRKSDSGRREDKAL